MEIKIVVVDYGAGNLRSVACALDALGLPHEITNDPRKIAKAAGVIVPGVGAAAAAMRDLRRTQCDTALQKYLLADRPYLGICLGLQILFEHSEEGDCTCLGVLRGKVKRLAAPKIKIPHIGWNAVDFTQPPALLAGIESGTPFYFVHSYFIAPNDQNIVVATVTHGKIWPALIRRGNIWGTQFHPEKSGHTGLRVLRNFADSLRD